MATAAKTNARRRLPPKLEAVLQRLCKQASNPLSITQAVKMPYLVDVLAQQVLGRRITEGHHETWQYGVVTSEAWHYLHDLPEDSGFRATPVPLSEEIRVEATETSEDEGVSGDGLTEEEARIVDFVAEEYAFAPALALGEMTKRMNPHVRSWGKNHLADVGGDAYERMSPEYLEMADAVARLNLDQLWKDSRPVTDAEDVLA